MTRAVTVNPADAVPIWKQIEEGIRRLVACGALAPGGAVPSVRDLARDLRVNPATVARAYQGLVDLDLLVVRRGEGTFVAEKLPSVARTERTRALREGATRYASLAVTVGAGAEESIEELRAAFRRLSRGTAGGGSER